MCTPSFSPASSQHIEVVAFRHVRVETGGFSLTRETAKLPSTVTTGTKKIILGETICSFAGG
jgi:hypothetical protein